MTQEIEFSKYQERGACHIKETRRSLRYFNAEQQARFELILRYLGDIKDKNLLDIGCGDGALTYLFCRAGANVTGVDNNELGLKFAREFLIDQGYQPQLILASAYNLPLPDNSVDFVVASEVIEHVQEPKNLLAEARRVLRPDGKIIISTPYRLTDKPLDRFHVKEFFPSEIKELVSQYFQEVELKETHKAFWHALYSYEFNWSRFKKLFYYLINFGCLYLKRNPFLEDSSQRKKWDFYTQLFVLAQK